MRAHITKTTSELKALKIEISEPFLVYFILDSLPFEYGPFKISYFTHKKIVQVWIFWPCVCKLRNGWSMIGLKVLIWLFIIRLELRKGWMDLKIKGNISTINVKWKKCNLLLFCKKEGHVKKHCIKYKKWFKKKGNSIFIVSH